jgi:hypothetical protein
MVVDMSFTKKVKTGTFFVTKILIITYIFFVNLKKLQCRNAQVPLYIENKTTCTLFFIFIN